MRKIYTLLVLLMSFVASYAYSVHELRELVSSKHYVYNAPVEARYFESFEGWDGSTEDWLPEGWNEIISNEDYKLNNDGVFTWHVGQQKNNKPYPVDGNFYANIYYAYETLEDGTTIDLPQDEWLLTPVYNVKNGDLYRFSIGYSAMFLYNLNNEYVDWGKMDFKERLISSTIKIYAREVDSESGKEAEWIELFDISDSWAEYSFADLFTYYFDSQFYSYSLDLSEFAEKCVQIAFRYVGMYGNTMELDAVYIENNVVEPQYSIEVSPMAEQVVETDDLNSFEVKFIGVSSIEFNEADSYGILYRINENDGTISEEYELDISKQTEDSYELSLSNGVVSETGLYRLVIPSNCVKITDDNGIEGMNKEFIVEYQVSQVGIKKLIIESIDLTVYSIDGVCLLKGAKYSDIKELPKGIYIVNGTKIVIQ